MLNGSFNEGSLLYYCGMIITMNALGYMLPSWGMCNEFSFVNVMSSCCFVRISIIKPGFDVYLKFF